MSYLTPDHSRAAPTYSSSRTSNRQTSPGKEFSAGRREWNVTVVVLVVALAVILNLFLETAQGVASIWMTSETYGHGLLIFPISLYLVWRRRQRLASCRPRPDIIGLPIVLIGALAWLFGNVSGISVAQAFALVVITQGVVLTVVGRRAARTIAFPLLFLFFAVPFGHFLIPPLQDITAQFIVAGLQAVGIPVYLDGLLIHIPSTSFEVAAACAGARYLLSTTALGTLVAGEWLRNWKSRALFLLVALLLPIVANGLRAFVVVLIVHYTEGALGVEHGLFSLVFMGAASVALLWFGYRMRDMTATVRPRVSASPDARPTPTARLGIFAACALLVSAAAPGSAAYLEHRNTRNTSAHVPNPGQPLAWTAVAGQANWRPATVGANLELRQSFEALDGKVDLYLAYFRSQRQGGEIVSDSNTLFDQSWRRADSGVTSIEFPGTSQDIRWLRLVSGPQGSRRRLVWYGFWVDGQFTASPVIAKLLEMRAYLRGEGQEAALLAISTAYNTDVEAAEQALLRVVESAGGVDETIRSVLAIGPP